AEYEADLERMREMCALLADYGLLEPFSMQATLKKEKGGGSMQMSGMHRVAEKNLENLNAAQLKNLMRKGYLARIYLHLLSLENFARLLDRKGERTRPSCRRSSTRVVVALRPLCARVITARLRRSTEPPRIGA
ncbi:MAG TPA: SapC family protein, partial [Burkholderiales bacterium]|nr:SapC family protein [Burkholderiales bacterium]